MVDINAEAEKTLLRLPYKLCFYYPEQWNELPTVSFYDLNNVKTFAADNAGGMATGYIAVDIWTSEPSQGGQMAGEVISLMEADGWWCELNKSLPKTDGAYHKTLRFGKNFVL